MAGMAKTAAERRAARKCKEQQRSHRRAAGTTTENWTDREQLLGRLVVRGAATLDE
jgi:hypothetical protein